MNVLIVLENDSARLGLGEAFDRAGHEVRACATLDTAKTELLAAPPDLLVIDSALPDGDGVDLAETVQNREATRRTAVIVLANGESVRDRLRQMPRGASEHLIKPCDPEYIVSRAMALFARDDLLREELQASLAESKRLSEELDTLTYSISHDLRQPLRSVDGFSRVLLEKCRDRLDEDGKHYLQRIIEASRRMGGLIEGLLALSRVAQASLERREVAIGQMARSICDQLKHRGPERDVTFHIDEGARTDADPHLLQTAVENLLNNAWKFTRSRAEALIELQESSTNPGVFVVRDNGVGFDMRYADKLFGPFQRLHPNEDFEGMGLGLATVRRIINRHGGKVWAESQMGVGASFYFTLGGESSYG